MTDETERLTQELIDERAYIGDLLHTIGELDARVRMMARAVLTCAFDTVRWMAQDTLAPGQRETVQAIQAERGVQLTGWPILLLAGAMVEHLDALPAPNYCTMDITVPRRDEEGGDRQLSLTAQWQDGETPTQAVAKAKAALTEIVAVVRAEAEARVALQRANEWLALTGELGMMESCRRVSEARDVYVTAKAALAAAIARHS